MNNIETNQKKLQIVMFPWLAFGHMLPFLELSKWLATKGHHIFFISTPKNLQRLPKIPHHLSPFITFVPLSLPPVQGLPHNAEATSDVGSKMGSDLLKKAYDGLEDSISKFLVSSPVPIDWIIYDFACYWLPPIADKLGIRKAFFSIFLAWFLSILGPMSLDIDPDSLGLWSSPEILTHRPPHWIPFPDSFVYFLPYEAGPIFKAITEKTSSGVSDLFRVMSCIQGSDLIVVRSCRELEDDYLQLVEKLVQKTVVPVGLLPPQSSSNDDDETWNSIVGWLDKQRHESVVYISFGSEFQPSQDQLTELALGSELSGVPFLWVFPTSLSKMSSLEFPVGFEERTRGRGMIYKSWVPQVKILSHESVGVSLIHAGVSSMVESVMLGKPLLMLPLFLDMTINARFMEDNKVGIQIPRNMEDGSITKTSVADSLSLMLLRQDAKIYRDNAKNMIALFADKTLQFHYIHKFSNHLLHHHKSTT